MARPPTALPAAAYSGLAGEPWFSEGWNPRILPCLRKPASSSAGSVRLLVRVVAGAHQGTGFHMPEAESERFFLQISELLRRIEARDRQMVARGAQVLAN